MDASLNNRGEAHENGAVESQNRQLKKAIDQALILRDSLFPRTEYAEAWKML
jgi:hypothetical protein